MTSDLIAAQCESPGGGGLELCLRVIDANTLQMLADFLRGAPSLDGIVALPSTQFWNANETYPRILVKLAEPGRPERIQRVLNSQGGPSLVWEGDNEYWLECPEKCDSLLEGGTRHQYLMVRGRADESITLSYREEKWFHDSCFADPL